MLFVSTVLVGCGTTAETKIDEKATEKTSVSKKVLNLMENSEIGSMDSIFTQDEASINAQSNVFEGLYQLDEKDQLIPAAAKEMPEISEDGKRYTIKLREDGKWSNGDAVTANDFVFAWRKLANPKNQANYFFLLEGTILNGYFRKACTIFYVVIGIFSIFPTKRSIRERKRTSLWHF